MNTNEMMIELEAATDVALTTAVISETIRNRAFLNAAAAADALLVEGELDSVKHHVITAIRELLVVGVRDAAFASDPNGSVSASLKSLVAAAVSLG